MFLWLWRYCNTGSWWWYMGRCYWPRILSFPLLLHWKHSLCSYISAECNKYYHHTDEDSARQILDARKIIPSEKINGDAVVGNGVYLNQLGPSNSRSVVAKHNFDGSTTQYKNKIQDGKVDVAIEMQLPNDKVQDRFFEWIETECPSSPWIYHAIRCSRSRGTRQDKWYDLHNPITE